MLLRTVSLVSNLSARGFYGRDIFGILLSRYFIFFGNLFLVNCFREFPENFFFDSAICFYNFSVFPGIDFPGNLGFCFVEISREFVFFQISRTLIGVIGLTAHCSLSAFTLCSSVLPCSKFLEPSLFSFSSLHTVRHHLSLFITKPSHHFSSATNSTLLFIYSTFCILLSLSYYCLSQITLTTPKTTPKEIYSAHSHRQVRDKT